MDCVLFDGDATLTQNTAGIYELSNWQQLQAMKDNLSANYKLSTDINFPKAGQCDFTSFEPIGTNGTVFSGTLDGNHKTVSGLVISNKDLDYSGLFGKIQVTDDAIVVVKDLTLKDFKITGNSYVGALAGELNTGKATNIKAVKTNNDDIKIDISAGNGKNAQNVGGLIGSLGTKGGLSFSSSTLNINVSASRVGGLVGYSDSSITVTGYATGNVTATGDDIGGLIGQNAGFFAGYATGDVVGGTRVGGLVGFSVGPAVVGYAIGKVTGINEIGGLVGRTLNVTQIVGYTRNTVVRTQGNTNTKFGLVVGSGGYRFITRFGAYHSAVGSSLEGITITQSGGILGQTPVSEKPAHGTAITITATTTKADFVGFSFGTGDGQWTWRDGKWPAINIGTIKVAADQPIDP